jgi:hypothetical protein
MATAVYFLCAATSASCAVLLFRMFLRYGRRARRLVLWSSLSFTFFALSNGLVFADLVMLPTADFAVARAATACVASALLLLAGLIWDSE